MVQSDHGCQRRPQPAHPFGACRENYALLHCHSCRRVRTECGTEYTPNHGKQHGPPSASRTPTVSAVPPTVSLVDLRCEVELQVAIVRVLEVVPYEQRCIWAKTKLHRATQRRGLGEIDKVTQRESGRDWLVHGEAHHVLGLLRRARLRHDVASAHVALDGECDALFGGLHLHRLAELLEVAADLLELR